MTTGRGGKVDLDQVQRVFGDVTVRGDHNGYGFANITYFFVRDRSLKNTLEPLKWREPQRYFWEVRAYIRRAECIYHAGYFYCRGQIDGVDPCMGMGATINCHHRHVRQVYIIDITAGPGQ